MTEGNWKTVCFNLRPEKKEAFQRAVIQLKADGELPPDANQSDVLREFVDEFLEEPSVESVGLA